MYTIHHGDNLEVLKQYSDNTFTAVVTDPPAGISFMGKDWDHHKGGMNDWVDWMTEVMTECLRVTKPGGYLLCWALPRTSHWTGQAIEQAGWEINTVVTHLFGTGFPKGQDIGKAIDKKLGKEREVVGCQ
jgi:site-specific DNA-methyltransferase (adenine-specific)